MISVFREMSPSCPAHIAYISHITQVVGSPARPPPCLHYLPCTPPVSTGFRAPSRPNRKGGFSLKPAAAVVTFTHRQTPVHAAESCDDTGTMLRRQEHALEHVLLLSHRHTLLTNRQPVQEQTVIKQFHSKPVLSTGHLINRAYTQRTSAINHCLGWYSNPMLPSRQVPSPSLTSLSFFSTPGAMGV